MWFQQIHEMYLLLISKQVLPAPDGGQYLQRQSKIDVENLGDGGAGHLQNLSKRTQLSFNLKSEIIPQAKNRRDTT